MVKQQANNSFAEGLMMDMNPMVTPNTVMTNCLNGTLVTFNGNEYMLQNDMGNGRVETAYLPEGYIPMGTCELGGIIYIVSYNPLKSTCLIGSFPSPERNITSDERSTTTITLSNKDFKWENGTNGAGIYYLKKDLDSELQFYPGDKFVVYSSNIVANKAKLNGLAGTKTDSGYTASNKETVRLSLGTVTSDGRLVVFDSDNLKLYNVGSQKYHIKEHSGGSSTDVDLDQYRSLVEQPYNVFTSKVSGTLVLIAELVQFDSFSASIKHHFDGTGDDKKYNPALELDFSGQYDYIPYAVLIDIQLLDKNLNEIATTQNAIKLNESSGTSHKVENKTLLDGADWLSNQLPSGYFASSEREQYTLNYTITPCMIWGPVKHLVVLGSVALDKIGTGYIGLSSWKYYNSDTKCNLTWGLDVYEEEDKTVKDVIIELRRLMTPTTTEKVFYSIASKNLYHGTFYELIPLGQSYYKLYHTNSSGEKVTGDTLYANQLYLVEVTVNYADKTGTVDPRKFHRWLYTGSVFNKYYYDTLDFKVKELDFGTKLGFEYSTQSSEKASSYYGFIRGAKGEETSVEAKKSLSAIQTRRTTNAKCAAKALLDEDFKTFKLVSSKGAFSASIDKANSGMTVSSQIKFTDREDSQMEELLANETLATYAETDLPANATSPDTSQDAKFTGDTPTYGNALNIITGAISPNYVSTDDSFNFNLLYKTVAIAKAYAVLAAQKCHSKGRVIPLAYDNNTFADYGLAFDGSNWKPIKLGTFGFREYGGEKGHCWIGFSTGSGFLDTKFCTGNNVDFNWTGDANILNAQNRMGWNTPIMFAAHHCTNANNDQRQDWINTANRKCTSDNGVTSDRILSWDSERVHHHNIVHLLIKSNVDNYYYPLNCARVSNASDISSYFGSNYTAFYKHIATILNNLYRYEDEVSEKSFWMPLYIYYGDNYTYYVNITLKALYDVSKGKVLIKIGDSSYIDLTQDFYTKFGYTLTTGEDNDLKSNVKYTVVDKIKNNDQTLLIVTKDTSSGITLRNTLLDRQATDLGVIIMDYNGGDSGKSITLPLKPKYIYTRNGDDIIQAFKFNPVQLNYSGGGSDPLLVTATTTKLFSSDYNISKNFTLDDDGLLLAKDPAKSELTLKRNGEHDTGYVYGYLRRGLSPNYEFWK